MKFADYGFREHLHEFKIPIEDFSLLGSNFSFGVVFDTIFKTLHKVFSDISERNNDYSDTLDFRRS